MKLKREIQRHRFPVNLTIDPDLRRRAEKLAFLHNMSLSQLVSRLLKDHCSEDGKKVSCEIVVAEGKQ